MIKAIWTEGSIYRGDKKNVGIHTLNKKILNDSSLLTG